MNPVSRANLLLPLPSSGLGLILCARVELIACGTARHQQTVPGSHEMSSILCTEQHAGITS